jgi:translocation and assembly module TamB
MLLLFGCIGAALWYLQTDHFQGFARHVLISRVEKATGLSCTTERTHFNVFLGKIEIDGLTLAPRKAAPGLVMLRVPQIRASISISSFWHLRMRLAGLDIIRPQVELISGGGDSTWNPEEALKTLKISLRLEAARVRIQEGLLQINHHTSPFNLSLQNFNCEIRYSNKLPSYKIQIAYAHSRIFWERRDIVHNLEANLDLSLRGIEIEFFKFGYSSSLLTGSGSIRNWKEPVLLLHVAGLYDARDLTLAHPSIHEGHGTISILADIRNDRDGVSATGKFSSRTGGYRKMKFHDLAGRFDVKHDVLFLRDVSGGIANGSFRVDADIQLREANRAPNRVAMNTKNVPLIEAGRVLDLPLVTFENPADTSTTVIWHNDRDLRANCNLNLHGLAHIAAPTRNSTPLDGNAEFTYLGTGEVLMRSANLASQNSSVQAQKGSDGAFHVQLSTKRISEPFYLVASFSPAVLDLLTKQPDLLQMAGDFQFAGDVQIKSSTDVSYRGGISIKNGSWRRHEVDALAAQVDFAPPYLQLRSMTIHEGPQMVRGDVDLELADSEHVSNFEFRGNVSQISITSLKDFGADNSAIDGSLSGNGSVRYARGVWGVDVEFAIDKGSYRGESFDRLRARVKLADKQLRLFDAEARRGTALATAEGEVGLETRRMNVAMRLNRLPLEAIPAVQQKRLPVQGYISASGVLTGTMDDPAFSGTVELNGLQFDSWDLGNGKGKIEFRSGTVQGDLRIRSDYGSLAAQGQVSTGPGNPGVIHLDFENLDVRKIAAAKIPPYLKEVSSALKGNVEIDGKFNDLSALRMRGEVDGASFKIQDYELRNAGRLQFTVLNRSLRIENVKFEGEGTSLVLSGRIPLEDAPQLDLNLNGSLNLRILEGIDKKLRAGGVAVLNIRASGSTRNPQVIGRASLHDAQLDYAELPTRFSALQGDILFSRDLVRFENIRGNAASGTLQLSGVLEHRNAVLRSLNLNISARNARLPYPRDFRSVVNADLFLSGTSDLQVLTGEVDVVRAEYVRDFNLLEQLAGGGAIQSGPLTSDPNLRDLRLNVEIRSDKGLLIDNELAKLRGSMRLTLRGTPAYPSLTGRVEASEGTIFFRGSRFEISHAAADFVDRNRMNPVLEVRAEADVKTYRLILDAVGELDHLNLNITSDPPMSTVDILSMLTTGKKDSDTATTQQKSEIVGMSAASVLSENLTGVIGKRVQRIFGLESFRVDPFLAGAENDPTARITVSERLSKDLVVTFSRNLTTNQEQIVVIEYDVTRDLSLLATRDEDGKYGLDFRFRKRWR